MTKFNESSFSVPAINSQKYRDNWERIFKPVCVCGPGACIPECNACASGKCPQEAKYDSIDDIVPPKP